MSLRAKRLACKHEGQSLDSQNPHIKPGRYDGFCKPTVGGGDRELPRARRLVRLAKIVSSAFNT